VAEEPASSPGGSGGDLRSAVAGGHQSEPPHRAAANADMERSRIRPWHRGLAEGKDLCQLAQIRGQGVADLNPLLGEP